MLSFQLLLSTLAPIAIMLMLVVFAELSRRLAVVVRAKPFHRWFYVAAVCVAISMIYRLLNIGRSADYFDINDHPEVAAWYIVPMAIGLFAGIVMAWRYWGWLIYASEFTDM